MSEYVFSQVQKKLGKKLFFFLEKLKNYLWAPKYFFDNNAPNFFARSSKSYRSTQKKLISIRRMQF